VAELACVDHARFHHGRYRVPARCQSGFPHLQLPLFTHTIPRRPGFLFGQLPRSRTAFTDSANLGESSGNKFLTTRPSAWFTSDAYRAVRNRRDVHLAEDHQRASPPGNRAASASRQVRHLLVHFLEPVRHLHLLVHRRGGVDQGSMLARDEVERTMRRFADQVMPKLAAG
jgi:hypothetical protein